MGVRGGVRSFFDEIFPSAKRRAQLRNSILNAMEALIVHVGVRKELKLVRLYKSFQKFTMAKAL